MAILNYVNLKNIIPKMVNGGTVPAYKYYSDPTSTLGVNKKGKYWYRVGDDGTYHSYTDETGTIIDPTKDITDWGTAWDTKTYAKAITNLKTPGSYTEYIPTSVTIPITTRTTWNQSIMPTGWKAPKNEDIPITKSFVPTLTGISPYDPSFIYNTKGDETYGLNPGTGNVMIPQKPSPLWGATGIAPDIPETKVKIFAEKQYDEALKNISLQNKYNTGKTITDFLTGSAAYLANRTRKAPEMVTPARTTVAQYTSPYSLEKGLVDNALATSMGSMNKIAREMGTPEYVSQNAGSLLDSQLKAYLGIGADVQKVDNLQREAIAAGSTADDLARYTAKTAYDTALTASNLQSSQTEAAQLSANSGILDQFIKNKAAIGNSKNLQAIYKAYLNNELSPTDFVAILSQYGIKIGDIDNTSVNDTPIYDENGNITGYK